MTLKPGEIKNYFLSLLQHVGDLADQLSNRFYNLVSEKNVKEKIGTWEFRLASIVNRKDHWIGLLPLVTGLIIVFIIMGSGIFNIFVLALIFLIAGAVIVGQKEKME